MVAVGGASWDLRADPPVNKRALSTRENGETRPWRAQKRGFRVVAQDSPFKLENDQDW